VTALGDLKEIEVNYSQMLYGGYWSFVGSLDQWTAQVSGLYFRVWKGIHFRWGRLLTRKEMQR